MSKQMLAVEVAEAVGTEQCDSKLALKEIVRYLVASCNEVSDAIEDIDKDKQFKKQMKKLKNLVKQVEYLNEHGKMPEKSKRVPSAYNNFVKARIAHFKKYTFMTTQECFTMAAMEWKQLTAEEKAAYKTC